MAWNFGNEYVYNTAYTDYNCGTNLTDTSFVSCYRDNYGYLGCKIGTVNGSNIAYGLEYLITSNITDYSVDRIDDTSFILVYRNGGNGFARKCTITNNTEISYGLAYSWTTSALPYYNSVAMISVNEFMVSYRARGNSNYGTSIVGEINGGITYGAEAVFQAAYTTIGIEVRKLDTYKPIILYKGSNGYPTVIIATVIGTDISNYGLPYIVYPGNSTSAIDVLETTKIITSSTSSGWFITRIGTINGTVIAFGNTHDIPLSVNYASAFHPSITKLSSISASASWVDNNDYKGYNSILNISGTSISNDPPQIFNDGNTANDSTQYIVNLTLTPNNFVILYSDHDNSSYGTSIVGVNIVVPSLEFDLLSTYNLIYSINQTSILNYDDITTYDLDYDIDIETGFVINSVMSYDLDYNMITTGEITYDDITTYDLDYSFNVATGFVINSVMSYDLDYEQPIVGTANIEFATSYDLDWTYIWYIPGIWYGKEINNLSEINNALSFNSNIKKEINISSKINQITTFGSKIYITTSNSSSHISTSTKTNNSKIK